MKEIHYHAQTFTKKFLSDKVALYTVLTNRIIALIDNWASPVMSDEYFDRTNKSVRGLVMKVHALTGKNLSRRYREDGSPVLRDVDIPPMLFTILEYCLEVRGVVAGNYEKEYTRTQDPVLGEQNRRHFFFREQLRIVLKELYEYQQEVDQRKAARAVPSTSMTATTPKIPVSAVSP